jgi:hypothetical protein
MGTLSVGFVVRVERVYIGGAELGEYFGRKEFVKEGDGPVDS